MPTLPLPFPTVTRAVNEKRRPPFTTLATRLIAMTRSSNSGSRRSLRSLRSLRSFRLVLSRFVIALLELQPGGAGSVGQRLDAPVVGKTTAVEDDLFDPGVLGTRSDELPDRGCRLDGQRLLGEVAFAGGRRSHGDALVVVDDLCIDIAVAAEHRESGSSSGAVHLLANPEMAASPSVCPLSLIHISEPTRPYW